MNNLKNPLKKILMFNSLNVLFKKTLSWRFAGSIPAAEHCSPACSPEHLSSNTQRNPQASPRANYNENSIDRWESRSAELQSYSREERDECDEDRKHTTGKHPSDNRNGSNIKSEHLWMTRYRSQNQHFQNRNKPFLDYTFTEECNLIQRPEFTQLMCALAFEQ